MNTLINYIHAWNLCDSRGGNDVTQNSLITTRTNNAPRQKTRKITQTTATSAVVCAKLLVQHISKPTSALSNWNHKYRCSNLSLCHGLLLLPVCYRFSKWYTPRSVPLVMILNPDLGSAVRPRDQKRRLTETNLLLSAHTYYSAQ